MSDEKLNFFRNRFLCKSCKKTLVSKQALDNHIIKCYEEQLDKIKEEYTTYVENNNKIKDEYQDKIEKLISHIYNLEQIKDHTAAFVNNIENIYKKI